MRVAIVGTGVSGLVAAWMLHRSCTLSIFEANDYPGGHSNTVEVPLEGGTHAVDTGFIVYNEATYPNFVRLLAELQVPTQPSNMSFSVRCGRTGLEYASSGGGVFAQRRNIANIYFLRMLADVLRFHRRARGAHRQLAAAVTLEEFVRAQGYSRAFRDWYLTPMLAAIWSADPARVYGFPAAHFLRFFENHGLLSATEKVEWRTISGGSREYVQRLIAPFADRIRLNTPVQRIDRDAHGVTLHLDHGKTERFDEVIIAAHSDQALRLLSDATPEEQAILGAIGYQRNTAVLHTDARLMPKRRRAWASWNYFVPNRPEPVASLTYYMNKLQNIESDQPILVTLNRVRAIRPEAIVRTIEYEHPVFSVAAMHAQQRHAEISGRNRTHFCGAYWGYGFHEDGVNSALAVAKAFGGGR